MKDKMMAVIYEGKGQIAFKEVNVPKILDPRDAIVKVGMSSICTSDIHIIHGSVPRAKENVILGHEFAGEVIAVGDAVKKIKPGDRVVANVETFCGECFYCKRGWVNNCVEGGWFMGHLIDGAQTDYVRVPIADNGLNIIPDNLDYEDVLMTSCILPSGFWGAELAEIKPGDTVAVIGSGPTGLTAMMSARLFGPANIVAIDIIDSRGQLALDQGWADYYVNSSKEDPDKLIKELTDGRGADAVIEVAGTSETFQLAWKIARPNAVISVVAMYAEDQVLPLPSMYGKNLIWKAGGVDASKNDTLIRLLAGGKINTRPMITHKFPLNDIEKAYKIFENHEDNCIKIAITPYED
ncbi:MAG: alcohol dehydrogenase catalytic domain-containing protein [Clostridiaceae bacterium]|jgi:alcohol dehydrogenase|nr:alcohol dehydrogenase catalytic domain-containing protein [Clostridiaceae bacterium]